MVDTVRNAAANRWRDVVNLVLGAWLVLSPVIVGFSAAPAATWNSVILGVVVAIAAVAALARFHVVEEWVNTVFGVWLIISPFLLGYTAIAAATWNHVIVGVVVAVLALWSIRSSGQRQAHSAA